MKALFILTLTVFSHVPSAQESKMEMISQKWIEVGLKVFGEKYKSIDKRSAETLSFYKDGTLSKELYGNLKFTGEWKFNDDSTKLVMALTKLNGIDLQGMKLEEAKPTDSIIRLTRDTLILGALGYYGNMRVYGHDDRYFVRSR